MLFSTKKSNMSLQLLDSMELKRAGRWHLDLSALQKQTGGKGVWLLLLASLKPMVKKLSHSQQLKKNGKAVLCTLQKHPQLWEMFLPLGTCQQIAEKITGVVKHLFSWLYGRSDCTDVNHFRYEMPKKKFHMMLTIRYPALGEGGGDADLSLVTPCRSLKMYTDHVIYQCPVQETVNNVRTNGETRNTAWSNW